MVVLYGGRTAHVRLVACPDGIRYQGTVRFDAGGICVDVSFWNGYGRAWLTPWPNG